MSLYWQISLWFTPTDDNIFDKISKMIDVPLRRWNISLELRLSRSYWFSYVSIASILQFDRIITIFPTPQCFSIRGIFANTFYYSMWIELKYLRIWFELIWRCTKFNINHFPGILQLWIHFHIWMKL